MKYEIADVCRRMLDNADLSIDLSGYPAVSLKFVVQGYVDGKFWTVRFECNHTISLKIENDSDVGRDDIHLVLGVSVNCKEKRDCDSSLHGYLNGLPSDSPVWLIRIDGHLILNIVCCEFVWSLDELSVVQCWTLAQATSST